MQKNYTAKIGSVHQKIIIIKNIVGEYKMFGREEYGERPDYEDTSRYLGEKYMEDRYTEEQIEERGRNEARIQKIKSRRNRVPYRTD